MSPTTKPPASAGDRRDEKHDDARDEDRAQDLTIHVFTISAGMVGVCLTGIGLLRLIANQRQIETLGDNLLAIDAVVFMSTCFLAFWAFKSRDPRVRRRLRFVVESTFMVALLIMVVVCSLIAYTLV